MMSVDTVAQQILDRRREQAASANPLRGERATLQSKPTVALETILERLTELQTQLVEAQASLQEEETAVVQARLAEIDAELERLKAERAQLVGKR